jgi:pimeloyl-ACP methyl ester carboxylesterase
MIRVTLLSSVVALSLSLGASSSSAQTPEGSATAIPSDAIGIAMEGIPYPFLLKFIPTEIEGQSLRMGYMDVQPTHPNGRAVVLLHGKNFYGSYWETTARALTEAGYRVVIPDQIGFGKSSKPIIEYTFTLLANQTVRLLDHLEIKQAAVVGHSMGGMLAVRLALDHADRFTHLILENPIGLEDYQRSIPPQTLETLTKTERTQTSEAYRKFVSAYHATPRPAIVEPFVDVRDRLTRSAEFPRWAHVVALTYQMIYDQPVRAEFQKIIRPTLLVIGQTDRTAVGKAYAPPEVRKTLGNYPVLGKQAAADIPGAKLVELDNVGHIPHLEAPDRFHAALLEFLQAK